jgi:hypothetical protein
MHPKKIVAELINLSQSDVFAVCDVVMLLFAEALFGLFQL